MYYSESCSYCSKVFYTFGDDKFAAAKALYAGIRKHLEEYGEDDKEHKFDDGPEIDTNEIYGEMTESAEAPAGGYQV